jgi:type II secretory pathway pseudopilin PulG
MTGHRHAPCSPHVLTTAATRSRAHESPCDDSTARGFTIFEALVVIILVFVIAATMVPKFGVVLGHARVNRAANVIAADLMLAQTLAGRQHAPVVVTVGSDSLYVRVSQPPPSDSVLRTYYFDPTSDFHLAALSATPASIEVMPNGTATASMVVTIGLASDYYHQVTMTLAGQVRVTR